MKTNGILYALCIAMLAALPATSQTRGRQNSGTTTQSSATKNTPTATPSQSMRPAGNQATQRPGTPTGSTSATRPGTPSGSTSTQRPGTPAPTPNTGGASQRPGTPNVRPSNPQPPKPANPIPPKPANPAPPKPAPVPPPPTGYHPGYNYRPPMPHTPHNYNYYRPTPPPSWRPLPGAPSFNTILGLTLGSLFSNSINYLFSQGYNVTGYTSNQVYLNNVMAYGINWPNATMYYSNGFLTGSLFSTSSVTYDMSTYNFVYSSLMAHYGMPISTQVLSGGGLSATWWGAANTYITLSFYPQVSSYGQVRYFTTLSTGN